MFLLSAALMIAMQTTPEFAVVVVRETPKGCEYRVEGRRLTAQQLGKRARVWADEERIGEVQGAGNQPNACIGEAMVLMQNAGMQRVGYVGKQIGLSVIVGVAGGSGCTPIVNGEAMTLDAFRPLSAQWGRDNAEIIFQPDSEASYECVDAVLRIIRESNVTRLGFVGNEQNVAR